MAIHWAVLALYQRNRDRLPYWFAQITRNTLLALAMAFGLAVCTCYLVAGLLDMSAPYVIKWTRPLTGWSAPIGGQANWFWYGLFVGFFVATFPVWCSFSLGVAADMNAKDLEKKEAENRRRMALKTRAEIEQAEDDRAIG